MARASNITPSTSASSNGPPQQSCTMDGVLQAFGHGHATLEDSAHGGYFPPRPSAPPKEAAGDDNGGGTWMLKVIGLTQVSM